MPLSSAAKDLMLQALDEAATGGCDFLSLHTAYSATGTNEVTGGSPAYARKGCAWDAASGGVKNLGTSPAVVFDVPASTTVRFIGMWDAVTVGTFLGMMPNGSTGAKVFNTDDSSEADTIACVGHGFAVSDKVVFFGSALPTGITEGTVYTVATVTDVDHFTCTGLTITADGAGIVQKIVEETFGAQGTFTVQTGSNTQLSLNLV